MSQRSEPKFLVDFMLGRLAKWLRLFGYDTLYAHETDRISLIMQSLKENRILITRDHKLSGKRAWKLVLINSDDIHEQLKQLVTERWIAISSERFYTKCSLCNAAIVPITNKEEIKSCVPEYVYATQNDFSRCKGCGRIYWAGTHRDLLLRDLQKAGIKI